MRKFIALALLLLPALAAADPGAPPERVSPPRAHVTRPARPVEIDFNPLARAGAPKGNCWLLKITLTNIKGKVDSLTLQGVAAPDVGLLVFHLKAPGLPAGYWKVSADSTDTKLIVHSHRGAPVRSIDVSLTGLDRKFTPTLRRVRKP